MDQPVKTPLRRGSSPSGPNSSVKRQRLNHETPNKTPNRLPNTPNQMMVAATPRTNRVKQRLAQAAATPRRVREDTGRQMTPRDILRALSRVMVREKQAIDEEDRIAGSGSKERETEESQDASPTSARSRLSGRLSERLSGRLSDATGMMGQLSMGSPTPDGAVGVGDVSMMSARSVELHRRVSVMSRLSNATRISDIFHTTNGAEEEVDGGQTPISLTPFKQGEMLPEMDLEFGEEIGNDMAASSDEDFGGAVMDYDGPEDEGGEENNEPVSDAEAPFSPPPEGFVSDDVVGDVVDEVVDEEMALSQPVETMPDVNIELDSPEEDPVPQDDPILFSDEEVPTQPTKKPAARRPRRKRATADLPPSILPRPFLKSLVASITGDNVDKSVIEELVTSSEMFFDQAADDLAAYTDHCKRKTVEPKDVTQLMRRQRLINNSSDVLPLAQRHLPAELIAELSDVFTIRAPKRKSKKTKEAEEEEEVEEETIGEITEDHI
ncbi:centromere kinetochore component CENP-T-domain-containing protein [Yarrowia lipolytica]|nr:centromere kinetochore component CENP-T-domain-containing protein [Yarrowia lipolytica]KAE8174125.1 centromere kinetochore component CENP-T-domain-containing protein [Yarrowia lipolytica]QNP95295.1 Inner kinetochore subunit cnp20 [Yarrowia lipolytica]RDW28073.1 centromere kinetochore component CENP-T-domain-containing protein [Yarrowia lipolytica]RDW48371.1 centromere kinetochore component CENP-T-domain-containing protein [Yarrowia lipolytica]